MILNKQENADISRLVDHYKENQIKLKTFLLEQIRSVLVGSPLLAKHVHSYKWRLKEPENLRRKLIIKATEAKKKGRGLGITEKNLFIKINDLVGVRILHLHTRQMKEIDSALKAILNEARFKIVEGPFARSWDDETKEYFKAIGIKTKESGPSMYTSVHYVIDSNSRTRYTAELQVRTLAEELWGEVSHVVDYPVRCSSLSCQEQIMVLARVTSSCTRLVDSIFRSFDEHQSKDGPAKSSDTDRDDL
jgi:putative GTP pyrophosphokinase